LQNIAAFRRKNLLAGCAEKNLCVGVKGTLHVPAFRRRMHERFPETFRPFEKEKLNKEGRLRSTASSALLDEDIASRILRSRSSRES